MWNMSESDKRFYDRQAAHEHKRNNALNKARNRGKVAEEWFVAGNVLTKENQPLFNALMKEADNNFKNK